MKGTNTNKKDIFIKNKKKKLNIVICIMPIIVILALLVANIIHNMTNYSVEFYRLASNKINDKIRIVFLSDLHLREYGHDNEELVADVENLSPDLIILGGDLVNESEPNYDSMIYLCGKLSNIAPAYGAWGNHEDIKMYIQKDSELAERFKSTGVNFLTNEIETIQVKGNEIAICGIDGNPQNFEQYGAKEVISQFGGKNTEFKICVAHVPTYFTEKLSDYAFDLGLSGHTHGGIVNIPKIGALYSQEEGFLPEYAEGFHRLKNNAWLVVSRGLGHSSVIPRINNVPELSVIDIN